MKKVKPGWYFYVRCIQCGNEIPFKEAPSPEEGKAPLKPSVTTTCPHCGARHAYAAAEVDRGLIEDEVE
jgi:NAD-dependent SIR2 family protein deacetylase